MDMGPLFSGWNWVTWTWAFYRIEVGELGMVWDWETLKGTHLVLGTWVPDGEPMWADYIGPIGNTHGPGVSGLELGNMGMGPIWNISGLTEHSMGLGNTLQYFCGLCESGLELADMDIENYSNVSTLKRQCK